MNAAARSPVRAVVAVVGRPNVGKSTLVNRIVGRREAIVEAHPGVTRDRKAVEAEWQGRNFTLFDTGGWILSGDALEAKVSAQAEQAIRQSDAVMFVVDSSVGLTFEDQNVARMLHSANANTPVVLVANKVDHASQEWDMWELLGLGFGTPAPVSALHGRGTGDLLDALVAALDTTAAQTEPLEPGDKQGHHHREHTTAAQTEPPEPGAKQGHRHREHTTAAQTEPPEPLSAATGDNDQSATPMANPQSRAGALRLTGPAGDNKQSATPMATARSELHEPLPESEGQPDSEGQNAAAPEANSEAVAEALSVVLVGRPNAGKSTLFNRLIGEDRSLVHDLPGTTRDTVDTLLETPDGLVRFVDTAGMRRRARIDSGTEYYSLLRALKAVDEADVALLVVDASVGVTHQDQRLAERVDAAGCPIVILLNKWDLLNTEARVGLAADVADRLGFLGKPPVLRTSALSGKGVSRLWPALTAAAVAYHTRIPTRSVNEVIGAAQSAQPAPGGARILYATQGATDPPTFTLFTNRTLPRTYLRYIERRLREEFDLGATALKFRIRRRDN